MAEQRRKAPGNKGSGALGVLDIAEMVIYGTGALIVLVGLLFLGFRAAYRMVGPVAVAVTVGMGMGAVTVLLRDARKKRWSPLSVGAVTAYVLCLLFVIAADARTK